MSDELFIPPEMIMDQMQGRIQDGEALSVREIGEKVSDGLYELRAFFDDIDYCDPIDEVYIWSIGISKKTGHIFAAIDSRFYENPEYDCVWLR